MCDLLERTETDVDELKARHLSENMVRFPFSSKRKRMSTILENVPDSTPGYFKRLHVKGASEIVKNCCSHYIDETGKVKQLTDSIKNSIDSVINLYAKQALRTIALAYKDIIPGECGPTHELPES